jgi:hypothetical protein
MGFRHFARPVLVGVLAGAITGFILALMVYMGGNSGFRFYGGWSAFFSLTLGGAGIGVVVSLSSVLTAFFFVTIADRRFVRTSLTRIRSATWGAVAGAGGFWIVSGVVSALSSDYWGWFGAYGVAAVVSALLAGILSAIIVSRAERRSTGTSVTQ